MTPTSPAAGEPSDALTQAIVNLVLTVPDSREQRAQGHPQQRARALSRAAARQASVLAGAMALPPGFLGWLTVLPELVGVWRLQAQMVSDIAAVYGRNASPSREQMMYCLFKQVSAQLFRDVVVRVGERYVVKATSLGFIQTAARTVGIKLTKSLISKSASRFVPVVGAVGVAAYAYFDTLQVAKTAMTLFANEVEITPND